MTISIGSGFVWIVILVLLTPMMWLAWWLVASAGEKVTGRKYTPHGR